ncbi:MAG: hypothetical protein BWY21_02187 [Parcubacteria group bacterium ADurb.Bin216]|nr:MAG: hypothetical protein BWY21_02187 [Parcubacteria group bacterium ADurb.Bin216]
MTREERNKHQREYRHKTRNACTNKYEKTMSGFLMRKYRNMKSRVLGIQYRKAHLYKGKDILPREDFYEWSMSGEFLEMFKEWEESGYDRRLCPTVDRIDPKLGYVVGNMRWLTHSENSRIGAIHKNLICNNNNND